VWLQVTFTSRRSPGFIPFSHINHLVVLTEHKVYAEPHNEFLVQVLTVKLINDIKVFSRARQKIHNLISKLLFKFLFELIMFVWECSTEYTLLNQSLIINCHTCIFLTSGWWNIKTWKGKQSRFSLSQLPIVSPWLFGGFKSLGETKVIFNNYSTRAHWISNDR